MADRDRVVVQVVNAFVDQDEAGRFIGGNPAGVVLEADDLDAATKQRVAAALGMSEIAFVSASATADFMLTFFTPTRQIAHCGHATVATFSYLAQIGRLGDGPSSKETIDGNRAIVLDGDVAYMEQLAPRYERLAAVTGEETLASLGLDRDALQPGHTPLVVDTGNRFLIVPLRSEAVLAGTVANQEAIAGVSERLDLIGYYPFTQETQVEGRDAAARMFAPRYGIGEESATGMAAGPLACYLHDFLGVSKTQLLIEQGRLMAPPSPSVITVSLTVDRGKISRLMAGGRGRLQRHMEVALS